MYLQFSFPRLMDSLLDYVRFKIFHRIIESVLIIPS